MILALVEWICNNASEISVGGRIVIPAAVLESTGKNSIIIIE